MPQPQTMTTYFKNFGLANEMKFRMEMSQGGITIIYLVVDRTCSNGLRNGAFWQMSGMSFEHLSL
jgi:hypothetical protein